MAGWGVLISVFFTAVAAVPVWGDLAFGLGEYPGGALRAVFLMKADGEADRMFTVEITPNSGLFDMVETISSPSMEGENLGSGLGTRGAAGTAGAQYDTDDEETIDVSPLSALDDRKVNVQPGQNYYLPDGARLIAGDTVAFAGITGVMCTYTHPSYSNQVVKIALTDYATSNLLLFPAYYARIVDGVVKQSIELVEFSHTL